MHQSITTSASPTTTLPAAAGAGIARTFSLKSKLWFLRELESRVIPALRAGLHARDQGARIARRRKRFAISSPTNVSLTGSQRNFRPSVMAIVPRLHTVVVRCAVSALAMVP